LLEDYWARFWKTTKIEGEKLQKRENKQREKSFDKFVQTRIMQNHSGWPTREFLKWRTNDNDEDEELG